MRNLGVLHHLAALALVGGALTVAVVATAAPPVPDAIGHQGRLFNVSGPISGTREMTFSLFEVPNPSSGDVPIWSETQMVTFQDGNYATALGMTVPLLDASGEKILRRSALYLQISVSGQALQPLAKLNSVPYALVCDDATGDIHPTSVSIGDTPVIDSNGEWVGSPTNLVGPPGPQGPSGVISSISAWGAGINPSSFLNFLGPTVLISVNLNESVLVTSQKAFGSTTAGGGTGLTLNICSQMLGGAITPVDGSGIVGLRVASGTRVLQTLSSRITNLAPGTYQVGLCGLSSTPASWNDNGAGTTTAVVVTEP